MVLNDEAHHCYRESERARAERLSAEERGEVKCGKEMARLWISGIEALQRVVKSSVLVCDLSATPFFLRGSGPEEGKLFPWVVSDFSLNDAIESGIVKVPRVPVLDAPGADEPLYRHIYKHIRDELPKAGRAKQGWALTPSALPSQLTGALTALYGHYAKVFVRWEAQGGKTPPVFIVVCNNTATSKVVFDYISGYRNEDGALARGALALFSNVRRSRRGGRLWRGRGRF